ncbi:MAG: TlpA disulfide reductase family protein [Candidatus Hydrogenedentes bacterium]|jgi:thiol-disulfide isomerase/thioredoxin|nr:TlpA disulfide reductase family protein [Candidatus Hydrogenedentota bacterium]
MTPNATLERKPGLSLIRAALCLLAAVGLSASCGVRQEAPDAPATPAHLIKLVSMTRIETLVEESRGRVLVVNFWATFCPPCVDEMPELASFVTNHVGEDIEFLSVSSDIPSTRDTLVLPFVLEQNLPFPVYMLGTDNRAQALSHMEIEWDGGLPATFIFNREGRPVHSWLGPVNEQILVAAVGPLL